MRSIIAAAGATLLAIAAPTFAAEPTPALTAAPTAPIDPARLKLAKETVDFVFPLGTYARMMGPQMDQLMGSMLDSTTQIPMKDLGALSGVDTATMGPGTMAEIMAIYDPAYKERMRTTQRVIMADMIQIMTRFEPELRAGFAKAYARRFDAGQLGELNRFFATPTGKAYAADSYIIMMSPDVMGTIQRIMPETMKAMPEIARKAQAATQGLPKPRTYAQLSQPEREKLAKLLGLSPQALDKKEAAQAHSDEHGHD